MKPTSLKKFKLFVYCTILTFQTSLQDIKEHENWKLLNGEECGKSSVTVSRIFGGIPAKSGQFPWMVRLGYRNETWLPNEYTFKCGGVLINKNYVLTVVHCITSALNDSRSLKVVRLGEADLTVDNQLELEKGGRVQQIDIKKIIMHENFNKHIHKHNIALLRLNKPATMNAYVIPICLSPERIISPNDLGVELDMIVVGATYSKKEEGKLLHVVVPLVPLEDCIDSYKKFGVLGEGLLCAGGVEGYGPCGGDSGGPLMKLSASKYYLIGLYSGRLSKNCGGTTPDIYTDVYDNLNWILNNIES